MNSNEFPVKKYDRAILNVDNVGHGTHWVGIKKKSPNVLEYQDSFGVPPPFHLKNKIIQYNPYVKQKPYQTNCGKFAFNFVK